MADSRGAPQETDTQSLHQPTLPVGKGLALAALGVVFGDIGTSPLYTMREIFGGGAHPVPITADNVLGILSILFWSLIIVVSIKYVLFVMRADNRGEGGIMALMALVSSRLERGRCGGDHLLMLVGLFGAALFYGDSVLTPAVSVLSAVEGLEVAAPHLAPYLVPIALAVLAGLFIVQRYGTARVGAYFGPVIVVWFLSIGGLGLAHILKRLSILEALNPAWAWHFLVVNPTLGFFSLGATVLALTGGEALYADMGHFGRHPIRLAWFGIVLPGLFLSYFGQGALLLANPEAVANPFYLMAPGWLLLPLVALATLATVIASQAVISGAYSLTRQAIQLGYMPRMEVRHTSSETEGQIYLPTVNWTLLLLVSVLVVGFGSSSALAAAYGIAVTGTMVITTVLASIVVRRIWHWHCLPAAVLVVPLLLVDLAYCSANLLKIKQGGWFPVALGIVTYIFMTTWKRGREVLSERLAENYMGLDELVNLVATDIPTIPGNGVFLTQSTVPVPHALLHCLKHFKSLHEQVVILTVEVLGEPHVNDQRHLELAVLNSRFYKLRVRFGFMDDLNVPLALEQCTSLGLELNPMETSFFLGRETIIPGPQAKMARWRQGLFISMARNAGSATAYFRLPPNRVIELGTQIVL